MVLCPQRFSLSLSIVLHDGPGHSKYVLSGSVILFELDNTGAWEVLFEIQNIADIRSAKLVDGLVLVSYHK